MTIKKFTASIALCALVFSMGAVQAGAAKRRTVGKNNGAGLPQPVIVKPIDKDDKFPIRTRQGQCKFFSRKWVGKHLGEAFKVVAPKDWEKFVGNNGGSEELAHDILTRVAISFGQRVISSEALKEAVISVVTAVVPEPEFPTQRPMIAFEIMKWAAPYFN